MSGTAGSCRLQRRGAAGTVADELVRRADRDGHQRHPSGLLPGGRHHGPNRPGAARHQALRYNNDGTMASRSNDAGADGRATLRQTAAARSTSATQTSLSVSRWFPRWTAGRQQHAEASMAASSRWTRGQGLRLHPACRRPFRCWTRRLTCSTVAQRRPARTRTAGRKSQPAEPYYEWLKTQPGEVSGHRHQGRHAKLLRSGSLSAGTLCRVAARNQFSTTDLDEMRRLEPKASRAGI